MTGRRLRVTRAAYRWALRTPAAGFLRRLPAERVRRLVLPWHATTVAATMRALEGAGATTWLGGGWGIDALLGGQTRRHGDLDLFYAGSPEPLCDALTVLGFELRRERYVRGKLVRVATARSPEGRVLDVVSTLDPSALAGDALTAGVVDGERVPCLSPAMQLALHAGYGPGRRDRHDVKRLCGAFGLVPPHEYTVRMRARNSALVIPVPRADPLVARHRARFDPVARRGLPAHVTLLFPFAPVPCLDASVEEAVGRVVAGAAAFTFRLTRVDRFPDVLYLAPEPADAFVELTRALARRWPEYQPYRGAHDEIVPHLTVAHGPTPPELEPELELGLPLEARAAEVWLMVQEARGRWSLRRRFPLGPVAETARTEGSRTAST